MTESILVFRELRKDFFDVRAVDDVSLEIPTGEIFGLIGPNGAGKTTTLRMAATSLEPTRGKVMFLGQDIWKDPVRVRRQIGFLPDFFQTYRQLTVEELLTYFAIAHGLPGLERRQRVNEVIEIIGLGEKRKTLCKGLSRGMVQRLGLGGAILHRPRLLLLDEPASGLDPLARKAMFDALRTCQAEGATILISSHILGELSDLCTSVGVMDEGRFLAAGETRTVMNELLPKRKIELRVLPDGHTQALQHLQQHAKVHALLPEKGRFRFDFDGTDEDLAALNTEMVRRGVKVVLQQESATSLHEAYFAVAKGARHASS